MKSRIIDSLQSLGRENPSKKEKELLARIAEETDLPEYEIQKKSKRILKTIIHDYAAFEVSTIDGFTHRVLRTFARDLELPTNFEVELDTEEVLDQAVRQVIGKAGEDQQLTRILVNFALSKTDEDKSWDIHRDLFEISKLLIQETNQPFLDLLKNKEYKDFRELSRLVEIKQKEAEEKVLSIAESFFQLLKRNDVEEKDFSRGACPSFFRKLQRKDFAATFGAKWQEGLETLPLYPTRLEAHKKQVLDRIQAEVSRLFEQAKEELVEMEFLKEVQKNLVPLSLLRAIQKEIEVIKKENSIVLISEFNETIAKAVKDQPAPFVYERLGEHYRHYFIDEFQDTSELQWNNLIPLVDHTLTSEHPLPENGTLTLVGDAKQSIYRWRGGKAEQFMELCKGKDPFNLGHKNHLVLPANYRSAREIVNFNNGFFRFASSFLEHEDHRKLFEKSDQETKADRQGYVNISFVEAEHVEEEMKAYPQRVLEIIRNLESEGFSRSAICILTRKKKESYAIANYLSDQEVPVISAESLLLNRSSEVRFINTLLKFSTDTRDKNLKYEILDFLLERGLQPEDEFEFLRRCLEAEDQQFFDMLKSFGIDIRLKKVNAYSVYEATEYILRCFHLEKDMDAYLQFFLDFVYEASTSEAAGIFEYLELWERKKETLSILVPEGEDAVQIMTIHKAKGLEFPVVIYPFANSKIKDVTRESFWVRLPESLDTSINISYLSASEKMRNWNHDIPRHYHELCCDSKLDALNVLYVAMTRPEQQLYVISKLDLDSKGNERDNRFSGLFISYLKLTGKWDGSLEYHFGDPGERPQEVPKLSLQKIKRPEFFSSPTQRKGISIISGSASLWDSRQKEALERGQLIHDLFSRINTEADVEQVLHNAREEGFFKTVDGEEIRQLIFSVLRHPELQVFYNGSYQNLNERDLISSSGKVLRPDRININGKKASLIDYKTGAENDRHIEQINQYAEVLEDMDFVIEKKLLVYINEGINISCIKDT